MKLVVKSLFYTFEEPYSSANIYVSKFIGMKTHWKDLFHFNRRERNGILVLVTLIFLVIGMQWIMPLFISNELEVTAFEFVNDDFEAKMPTTSAAPVSLNQDAFKSSALTINENETIIAVEIFDPNKATLNNWISVGLNKGQVKSIRKYLDKGGRFYVKSDVKKMYVISDSQYETIKPFLKVVSVPKKKSSIKPQKRASVLVDSSKNVPKLIPHRVELNTADTSDLKALKGIGSYYAAQIVKYRESLGGYYELTQLFEVNHMREETVLMILPFVKVDTSLIRKIRINKEKAIVMVVHPYITWEMATKIEAYRNFNKRFKSIRELIDYGLLNEELYSKLVPYLEL